MLENLSKQSWSSFKMICWTFSQPHSPKNHPVKSFRNHVHFSENSCHAHTCLISRLPWCIRNALCSLNTIYIPIYSLCNILKFSIHTTCNSTIAIITQISSLEQITISSPMVCTHNYIPYNCDIMLIHKVHALTYPFPHKSSHSFHQNLAHMG